ncbi:MAG: hypothetical protein ACI841_001567 [Planctomycetota bacterium]|jgi:hypothetical protein
MNSDKADGKSGDTMNCKDVRDELSAYRDGFLKGQDRQTVEEHLQGCADCRLELDEVDAVAQRLARLAPEEWRTDQVQAVIASVSAAATSSLTSVAEHSLRPVFARSEAPNANYTTPARRVAGLVLTFSSGVAAATFVWAMGWIPANGEPAQPRDAEFIAMSGDSSLGNLQPGKLEESTQTTRIEVPIIKSVPIIHEVEVMVPFIEERVVIVERPVYIDRPIRIEVPRADAKEAREQHALAFATLGFCSNAFDLALRASTRPPMASLLAQEVNAGRPHDAIDSEPTTRENKQAAMASWAPPSTLRFRREGRSISLVTHGNVSAVVPALIDRLEDEDPEVRGIVHDRLDAIRDEIASTAGWGARLTSPDTSARARTDLFGRTHKGEEQAEDDPTVWREWWEANAGLVVAFEAERSTF